MKVQIADIRADWTLQVREELDYDTVDRYHEAWEVLPPLELYRVEAELLLVDGFHRYEAAVELGLSEVDANITDGTRQQAEEAAILANTRHGKALTKSERNEAIKRLSGLGWTVARIAAEMAVSERTVQYVKNRGATLRPTVDSPTMDNSAEYVRIDQPEESPSVRVEAALSEVESEVNRLWEAQPAMTQASVHNALRNVSGAIAELRRLDPNEVIRQAHPRHLDLFLMGVDGYMECLAAVQRAARNPRASMKAVP